MGDHGMGWVVVEVLGMGWVVVEVLGMGWVVVVVPPLEEHRKAQPREWRECGCEKEWRECGCEKDQGRIACWHLGLEWGEFPFATEEPISHRERLS